MKDTPSVARVGWTTAHRIVRSLYPPIALFEDIADPADWEALARAEAATNPRVNETIGRLDAVPPERRVSGEGASFVMAPFTHVSTDRPSRFTNGTYGVYYAGDRIEVALFETIHHHEQFMRRTEEAPGWTSQFRELVGSLEANLHDLRGSGFKDCLEPDDYGVAQGLARRLRAEGSDGLVYPSVRYPDGEAVAAFWPDVVGLPVQARHYAYHWDGGRVDLVRDEGSGETFAVSE
ncbi:hypothetical protein GGQ59_002822 [Parvularcula dongshanensis]|uniref:RES domain-containing protein n=1 Tax=Parvularcula dongshanensis TaxID=1173995 RepID=A0A840I702_9PROT|nr:hypothetical protein [Parvularcula dongshanensis]